MISNPILTGEQPIDPVLTCEQPINRFAKIHLINQHGTKQYLDSYGGSDCNGGQWGVKTSTNSNRDTGSGTWEIRPASEALCPLDYPFAYLNGGYCCKTNEERPVNSKHYKTPQKEIDDGTCDGVDFNIQSTCCHSENSPCPTGSGCFDHSVGK